MDGSQTSASSDPVTSNGQTEHSTTEDDDSSYDSDAEPGQKRKRSTRLRILNKARKEREAAFANVTRNVYGQLRDEGYVLFIEDELSSEYSVVNSMRNRADAHVQLQISASGMS